MISAPPPPKSSLPSHFSVPISVVTAPKVWKTQPTVTTFSLVSELGTADLTVNCIYRNIGKKKEEVRMLELMVRLTPSDSLARGRCTRFFVTSILGAAGKGANLDSVCGSC